MTADLASTTLVHHDNLPFPSFITQSSPKRDKVGLFQPPLRFCGSTGMVRFILFDPAFFDTDLIHFYQLVFTRQTEEKIPSEIEQALPPRIQHKKEGLSGVCSSCVNHGLPIKNLLCFNVLKLSCWRERFKKPWSMLHLYAWCILILVVFWSSLHFNPRYILILVAFWSLLHFNPRCILIRVTSWSSLQRMRMQRMRM